MQTYLTATRVAPDDVPESEGVLVETADGVVRLALDDGEVIVFDQSELHAATAAAAA